MERLNLVGEVFGRLLVIESAGSDKSGHSQWLCRCDCGKEKIIIGINLRNGFTKSCGCLYKGGPRNRKIRIIKKQNVRYAGITISEIKTIIHQREEKLKKEINHEL